MNSRNVSASEYASQYLASKGIPASTIRIVENALQGYGLAVRTDFEELLDTFVAYYHAHGESEAIEAFKKTIIK